MLLFPEYLECISFSVSVLQWQNITATDTQILQQPILLMKIQTETLPKKITYHFDGSLRGSFK